MSNSSRGSVLCIAAARVDGITELGQELAVSPRGTVTTVDVLRTVTSLPALLADCFEGLSPVPDSLLQLSFCSCADF